MVARAVALKPHPFWARARGTTDEWMTRVFFVCKYFVVRLSTTKTTKILPLEKYPLYGNYCPIANQPAMHRAPGAELAPRVCTLVPFIIAGAYEPPDHPSGAGSS